MSDDKWDFDIIESRQYLKYSANLCMVLASIVILGLLALFLDGDYRRLSISGIIGIILTFLNKIGVTSAHEKIKKLEKKPSQKKLEFAMKIHEKLSKTIQDLSPPPSTSTSENDLSQSNDAIKHDNSDIGLPE